MRYFLHLAYNGMAYSGWQRQHHAVSVQQVLEEAFSTILSAPIEITGCGRTDAGVHASSYYAHFDYRGALPEGLLLRMNKFLPKDVALFGIIPVQFDAHARFDATYRAYRYQLSGQKDPFNIHTTTFFPFAGQLNQALMQEAAALLLQYDQFAPFCKTGSDAKTMHCQLFRSEWEFDGTDMVYHIAANRFLRGMVRLVVGMCVQVGLQKIPLSAVKKALDEQSILPKSLSMAPEGLYLCEVRYPYF